MTLLLQQASGNANVDSKSGKKGPPLTPSELYGGIAVQGLGSPAKIKKIGTTTPIEVTRKGVCGL